MTSPNSFYPPHHGDQEGTSTHHSGVHDDLHDFMSFPTDTYSHDQWSSQIQQLSRQQEPESYDMEDPVGHLLNLNEVQTSSTMDFEDNYMYSSQLNAPHMYAPQPNVPQMYNPPAGGVLPNLPFSQHYLNQLPFYGMGDLGSYLGQTVFDTVMPGPAAQEHIYSYHRNSPVEPPLTEPHFQSTATLPAPSTEPTNWMPSGLRSTPRHSPRATSRISGPSTLSTLDTSGVTMYSPSPTTPLNRASQSPGFPGPDFMTGTGPRQSPISPLQKRPFDSSADDSLHGRRVVPRHAGASNVHSVPSGGTDTSSIKSRVPGRGPTVPQQLYNVGTTHAFYFSPGSGTTVAFNVAEGAGIPLQQLLDRQSFHLQARDERIADMSGDTVSIRIEWPGYPSFTKQIASKDWKKERSFNTRERLAMKVAGAVASFFRKHANTPCDPPNSSWRIGPNGIRVEHVVLVSLHRVSQGSWQPKLCLLRDNAQQ